MTESSLHHLAAAYSLDALGRAERTRFDLHLAGCYLCRETVAEMRTTVGAFGEGLAKEPPPEIGESVMRRIRTLPQDAPRTTSVRKRGRGLSRDEAVAVLLPFAVAVSMAAGVVLLLLRG